MASSSAPSSPSRPVFVNRTNVADDEEHLSNDTLIPLTDKKRLLVANDALAARKRVKVEVREVIDVDAEAESDSDDDEDASSVVRRPQQRTVFGSLHARMTAGPSAASRFQSLSTRQILQTFVSSDRLDLYLLPSMDSTTPGFTSPPYACAYSHAAKRGQDALLAVSTEEGYVHIMDTSQRDEWQTAPQRRIFQQHINGAFDVQWSPCDSFLATASADRSICIARLTSTGATTVHRLQYHVNTVKCITWDPTSGGNVLCSGSRDGMICIWDLRSSATEQHAKPVAIVANAHDVGKPAPRKKKMAAPPARGVTSLLFSERSAHALISSGTYDGILRQWDLRRILTREQSGPEDCWTTICPGPASSSSSDPTEHMGTRRARGITSMSPGSGPTAGLIFALSNDSRVHTYDMASLEPLSGWTTQSGTCTNGWSYGHEHMRTNSFYVRLAMSPCGRWLACGGANDGSAYLFDVSSSTAQRVQPSLGDDGRGRGIELSGQKGEVGAVDWAAGSLATCADDGTVRVWRPDAGIYRKCVEEPAEMTCGWSWAKGEESR